MPIIISQCKEKKKILDLMFVKFLYSPNLEWIEKACHLKKLMELWFLKTMIPSYLPKSVTQTTLELSLYR